MDKARKNEQPFFIWYAVFLPHTPHNAPDELYQKYKDLAPDESTARYWANIAWLDETCRQMANHLKEKDLYDNTLFVFTKCGFKPKAPRFILLSRNKNIHNIYLK